MNNHPIAWGDCGLDETACDLALAVHPHAVISNFQRERNIFPAHVHVSVDRALGENERLVGVHRTPLTGTERDRAALGASALMAFARASMDSLTSARVLAAGVFFGPSTAGSSNRSEL